MANWIDDVPKKDRGKVRESYKKAKTLEAKIALRSKGLGSSLLLTHLD